MNYVAYEYDATKADKRGAMIDIPSYFSEYACGIEDFLFYHGKKTGRKIAKYIIRKENKTYTYTYRNVKE